MMEVPVFDLSRFAGADGTTRRALSAEVDNICRNTGFLAISGHGVPQFLIDGIWSKARAFFDLPLGMKLSAGAPYPGYPYGYLPPQTEALARSRDVATPPDLKESFNGGPLAVPPGLADPEALRFCYAPTIWPREPPGFIEAWHAYYRLMEQLAARIMRVFLPALSISGTITSIRSSIGRSARFGRSISRSRRSRHCRVSCEPELIATTAV